MEEDALTPMHRLRAAVVVLVLSIATIARAQARGGIAGRVIGQDDIPLVGVKVLVEETGDVEWSGLDGRYKFSSLNPGQYTLMLTLGTHSETRAVSVAEGEPTLVELQLDWRLTFIESIVVTSASRQVEPLAEASAAITTLDAADINRQSASGQLPSLLAGAPGVQIVQSGLYDFNVNARGFNDLVNRRVRTEIDGRDASMPQVMGYTNWASLAFGLGEVDQIEFVNGPGGALYGVGALNGVFSIHTRAPADSLGGTARFTFGELDTLRGDVRQAVALGNGWYMKFVGGYQRSADFARSRVTSVEYAPGLLSLEAVPLARDRAALGFGSVRVDRQLKNGSTIAVEGGTVSNTGQVQLTNLGRYQAADSSFPWVRGEFRSPKWNVLAAYSTADIKNQLALSSGQETFTAGSDLQIDAHTNETFAAGRGRWVGGGSYSRQRVDSANPQGVETSFARPETTSGASAFGQIDYTFADRLRATFAGRIDASTLNRTTASPRAALVYQVARQQHVRFAFSRAYKAPTIAERLLQAPIAPPVNLSPLEGALAPLLGGTPLGFANVPVLAVGNAALNVEETTSVETGYSMLLGGRTFLQATYYRNHVNTFTSGLLPQIGTSLGRLNSSFRAYQAPSTLSPAATIAVSDALAAALPSSLLASMSNLPDGSPVFAVLSLANFGEAATQGVELSARSHLTHGWRVDASYAWFDFSIDNPPDIPLMPNTPRHQGAAGVTYVASRFDAGVRARLVEGFQWVSGIYAGPVPSYGVIDVQANYPFTRHIMVGIDVSNLLDHAHYEMFGGDLLRRRALAHYTVSW